MIFRLDSQPTGHTTIEVSWGGTPVAIGKEDLVPNSGI